MTGRFPQPSVPKHVNLTTVAANVPDRVSLAFRRNAGKDKPATTNTWHHEGPLRHQAVRQGAQRRIIADCRRPAGLSFGGGRRPPSPVPSTTA